MPSLEHLDTIADRIRADWTKRNAARDATLTRSRELIRLCATVIRASHRDDFAEAQRLLAEAHEVAVTMAEGVMQDPERALEVHMREELGVDPSELGNPIQAAWSSFLAFAVGAVLPLLPWFFGGGTAAVVASGVLGLVGATVVGLAVGYFTERSLGRAALRQVVIAAGAAAVTYAIGAVVGAEV